MKNEQQLAKLWCEWNGQRGTDKQVAKVLRTLDRNALERMLTARGDLRMSFYDDEAIAQERFDADCDMSDLIEAGNEAARLIREGDKLRAAGRHFDAAKRCPHNGGYGLSGTMATDRNDPHAGTLGFRCCDCGARMDRDPWVEGARIRSVEPDMIDGR